ncbi:MAG: murein biosynthesis integral membrane protein MurJ [Acidobacteria bacterium]|nr:murein biosynthesis integral membrane protein MurJ [Acidobacteriota bacterium]
MNRAGAGPGTAVEATAPGGGRLAHAAGLVTAGTLLSRIFGLIRDQLFAALFGAGAAADAFVVAFRIPNLLRDLFAEGALSAAFVPAFTDALHNRSRADAFALANRLMTTLSAVLGALVLAGLFATGALVGAIAPGFAAEPGKFELTVRLTRIMLPFLPLVSLAAVAMGMLNSLGRFFVPAFAPACFNIVAIATGLALWLLRLDPVLAVTGWAAGTLLGGLAQFVVQVPALRREHWRLRPALDLALSDPGLRRMALLMAPAAAGLAATQVNIFVNSIFASQQAGAIAWLNYAFRLMQLPLGLFGVAVGTIATASLARRAAAGDVPGLGQTLRSSLRLVGALTIPATLGLMVLARPIIRLIFEHGNFTAEDTAATAAALVYYAVGLFAYSSVKSLAPAFYAVGRAGVPLGASVAAVAANIALNVALFPVLGFRGLALGTSVAALVNFAVLALAFQRSYGGLADRGLAAALGRMTLAAGLMALVAFGANVALERLVGTAGLAARLAGTLGPIALGAAAYAGLCRFAGVGEIADLLGGLRRRARARG